MSLVPTSIQVPSFDARVTSNLHRFVHHSSFFISNDHYFYGGGLVGHTLRTLEGHFGPWRWATDIVYCTASDSGVDCKSVSPPNSQPSANGVLLVDEGKTLLVNDVVEATTTVYDVDTATGALSVRKKVVRAILRRFLSRR